VAISHDKNSHDDERQRLANSKTATNSNLLEWLLATTKTATTKSAMTMNASGRKTCQRRDDDALANGVPAFLLALRRL
jgi:hypothetical protein